MAFTYRLFFPLALFSQPDYAVAEFETRSKQLLMQMQEQGLNASLYYENTDFR